MYKTTSFIIKCTKRILSLSTEGGKIILFILVSSKHIVQCHHLSLQVPVFVLLFIYTHNCIHISHSYSPT